MGEIAEGELLWEPSELLKRESSMARYMSWLESECGLHFRDYNDLWRWSVENIESFWASIWRFFNIVGSYQPERVLDKRVMPGAHWFPGSTLNYAEQVFRREDTDRPAIIFQSERKSLTEISWSQVRDDVASVASGLKGMGVQRGDRVVAYLPNTPEAVIAFLATASLGAIWSSCSPDFGTAGVVDRFKQIEPKVLFAIDGYQYNGKVLDRLDTVVELQEALPTLTHTVLIPYLQSSARLPSALLWQDLLGAKAPLHFEQVPFEHPLWVLYSSGTTGLPKAIVQGHGGIVLEHVKALGLHLDLDPEDRFFWFTTTGWMMWNYVVGGLLMGSTILLYDGSPAFPTLDALWSFAESSAMTYCGTSASYLTTCMKAGMHPAKNHDLTALKGIGSTGSPLPPEGFNWVYRHVNADLLLGSASGGTDVCTAFALCCPLLPVHAGELQCRGLGAKLEAFNEDGKPVVGEVGELVITEPMPSMPLFFWNDTDNARYLDSYFDLYPGIWRHGDWVKITSRGSAVIYGRSDATLNRGGVRIGSSEIYAAVDEIPEVEDSLIIGVEEPNAGYYMPLFVVLREGISLDDALRAKIADHLRSRLSPRYVPDEILAIKEVPRTLNGKKLEVPVKKILMGMPAERAATPDSMSNPASLQYFVDFARKRT